MRTLTDSELDVVSGGWSLTGVTGINNANTGTGSTAWADNTRGQNAGMGTNQATHFDGIVSGTAGGTLTV